MKNKFIIEEADFCVRIDACLSKIDPSQSRSQWQRLIKEGLVTVNGSLVGGHQKIKLGDVIVVESSTKSKKQLTSAVSSSLPDIKIVCETEDYLVIDKPAGLTVHPTASSKELTLVDWLKAKYPRIKKVGDDAMRPGIVHRLDKPVSGLMVVALTNKMFNSLKEQFQTRTVTKKYLALVYGNFNSNEGEINFLLERSSSGHKMAAKPLKDGKGKEAITEYRVKQNFHNYALVELEIKTGRTHQIRAHLAAFNHQIVGDQLYATATTRIKNKKFNLGRVWLFSAFLAFDNLSGERVSFKAEIPSNLSDFMKTVK